jgi:hypothetical protein
MMAQRIRKFLNGNKIVYFWHYYVVKHNMLGCATGFLSGELGLFPGLSIWKFGGWSDMGTGFSVSTSVVSFHQSSIYLPVMSYNISTLKKIMSDCKNYDGV